MCTKCDFQLIAVNPCPETELEKIIEYHETFTGTWEFDYKCIKCGKEPKNETAV